MHVVLWSFVCVVPFEFAGWEAAYDLQIGPYLIDHSSWKTYLPEDVPTQWTSHLTASYGCKHKHPQPQSMNSPICSISPSKASRMMGITGKPFPSCAHPNKVTSPKPSRVTKKTNGRSVKAASNSHHERAASSILTGKVMNQMQVLHSELVFARKHGNGTTDGLLGAIAASAQLEISALAAKRTNAESNAAEQQLDLIAWKSRINTRTSATIDTIDVLDEKEHSKSVITRTGSVMGRESAIKAVCELETQIRQQCNALGAT